MPGPLSLESPGRGKATLFATSGATFRQVETKTLFFFISKLFISETCPFGRSFIVSFRVDTVRFLLIDCLRCESG